MNKQIWLVSDTHFNHYKIIEYAHRPFSSVKEMDETMADNWNSVVKDDDIVWHLGDVAMFKNNYHLPYLKGHKNLILGNHDSGKNTQLLSMFEDILSYKKFPKLGLLLTHVPVHPNDLYGFDREYINVHGHIHDIPAPDHRYRNMSVERINYTPIPIEEVFKVK